MRERFQIWAMLLAIAAGALGVRLPLLDLRPLHTDEAVQAVKAGALIDRGVYRYDPHEFHGPTLYYLTLPIAWARGQKTFGETDIVTFRLVPVLAGTLLVALTGLLLGGISPAGLAAAALLAALSPAFVFYSRYYIQELLLVAFTMLALGSGWRYAVTRRAAWAIACGLALGLMHATKETCVIAWFAMIAALAVTLAWPARGAAPAASEWHARGALRKIRPAHLALAVAAGALISALFFSSFLTHPAGVVDSITGYRHYLVRAGGREIHAHPPLWYLQMLLLFHHSAGPWWSEALILALGGVGALAALRRRGTRHADPALARFLAVYTLVLTLVYSIIPYKTPWTMLTFLHGWILLAGIGFGELLGPGAGRPWRWLALWALFGLGLAHLAAQARRQNYDPVFSSDPRNPYVYAHSVPDAARLGLRIEAMAELSPERRAMLVRFITPDLWPMPYYLRRLERVGYWEAVPPGVGTLDAGVVVTTPELAGRIEPRLRDAYQVEFFGLRPDVLLQVFIREDLWRLWMERRLPSPLAGAPATSGTREVRP